MPFYKDITKNLAPAEKLIDLAQILRFFGVGFSGKVQEMVHKSSQFITSVLFCGPQFSASQNYTREYVQKYPFIKVFNFLYLHLLP